MTRKQKEPVKLECTYKILKLSEDGLLKEPISVSYGRRESIFKSYGYETEEEALEAIRIENSNNEYIILPFYSTEI